MQSDELLCVSRFGKHNSYTYLPKLQDSCQSLSRTGRCESYLAANLEDRFSLIQFQPIKTPNTDLPILNGRVTALIPIRIGKVTKEPVAESMPPATLPMTDEEAGGTGTTGSTRTGSGMIASSGAARGITSSTRSGSLTLIG